VKLALYSVSYNGLFYRDSFLTLEQVIEKAANMGYDGVEVEAKRPQASPLDLDKESRKRIKGLAEEKGIEIPVVAAYNNFTSPVLIHRENELLMVREQIKMASDLGAKIVRVFAAWRGWTLRDGKGIYDMVMRYEYPDVTRLEQWRWCKNCLKESAKVAEEYGITLALQNHGPLIRDHRDVIDMVQEVGSPWLKVCLDLPLFPSQDPEYIKQVVKEVGDLIVHSHSTGNFVEEPNGEIRQIPLGRPPGRAWTPGPDRSTYPDVHNYSVFLQCLKEIGYNGYLSYEICSPVIINGEYAPISEIDKRVKNQLRFMRKLLQNIDSDTKSPM